MQEPAIPSTMKSFSLRPPVVGRHVFFIGEELNIEGRNFRVKSMNRQVMRLRLQSEGGIVFNLAVEQVVHLRNSRFTVKKWDGRNLKLKLGVQQHGRDQNAG